MLEIGFMGQIAKHNCKETLENVCFNVENTYTYIPQEV